MRTVIIGKNAHSVLTFRKWGRKNYSLFRTLHKTIIIGVLSVSYFLSTPITALNAAGQDTTEVKMEYDLDEIEISAQRTPAMYSQVARIISVIGREEIEAVPAQSVQDLLEYVAAIDVRQRGAEGVQADISIRGGTFDQTLILLNGINITDPQTGHHNLNLPVSLAQIERIEILEGPAARIFGPNAFSGAINIITVQANRNNLQIESAVGSFGYFDGNLAAGLVAGKWSHTMAFSGKRSDGYIDNTDFKELNGFYSGRFNSNSGKLKYQLGLSQKGFGANSFYTPKYPNQYENTRTLFASIKWEGNDPLHITPAVYYRRHHDRFELFRSDPASWYSGHNYHLTHVYGLNLNSWFSWSLGKTALGLEYRSEEIFSNVLGKDMEESKDVPGEDAVFTKSDKRNTVSGFLEHAVYLNTWTFTAGLMANSISGSESGIHIFPGIDISYEPFEGGKLFATYNTSLRMPTFTDLYYQGPTNIGNPDLKPERSATIEGGMKIQRKLLCGHLVVFYRKGKDIIDWVKEKAEEEIWQPQNLTEINSLGTEAQVQFLLRQKFGQPYPNLRLSYLYNHVSKGNTDIISNYVLDNLKNKFSASLNQQLIENFTLDLKMVYQDREGSYTLYEQTNPVEEVSYDPFITFDGKLTYRRNQLHVFLTIRNIFDISYNDIGNVLQPGRWIKSGIVYQIDFK